MPEVKIDGQNFDLSADVLDAILDAIGSTTNDGHEHGFLMCDGPKNITPGKKCAGNECAIKLEDCGGAPVVGEFHSHPKVISFSMSDYLHSISTAKKHPANRHLTCISLLDKGIRCKAVTHLPPPGMTFIPIDNEPNRETIKPFFTPRVNIGLEQVAKLIEGVPWDDLPPSEIVTAIDETQDVCAGTGKGPGFTDEGCPTGAYPWPEEPTGVYPWSQKQQYKSVKTPMGVAMEPIEAATILSPETEFIDIKSIETPDPDLIAMGEVMGYVNALTPLQLLKKKDADGKWIIHDGRHRLVAWKIAGFKQMPVVFVEP